MHQDKRGYWYSSKRIGSGPASRVVREYMGRSDFYRDLSAFDARRREEERRDAQAPLLDAQAQARALDVPLDHLGAQVKGIVKQVLEAHGYHLHARSQWRKRRGNPRGNPMSKPNSEPANSTAIEKSSAKRTAKTPKLSDAEHKALRERARTDSEAARQYLDNAEAEGAGDWYVRLNDVAHNAQTSLINSMELTDELFKALCARRMQHIRRDLGGDNPTPLERMLIERIALCWLHVHIVEMTVSQRSATMTLTVAEYQQKRLDKAHKRHLSAMKALAQVRRLQLPAPAPHVQINVAREGAQVNAAQVALSPL